MAQDDPFEKNKAIYYLESISRNLKEFRDVISDIPFLPSIGSDVLADNHDWLDCYIDKLRSEQTVCQQRTGESE